jgi:hypothetical protein
MKQMKRNLIVLLLAMIAGFAWSETLIPALNDCAFPISAMATDQGGGSDIIDPLPAEVKTGQGNYDARISGSVGFATGTITFPYSINKESGSGYCFDFQTLLPIYKGLAAVVGLNSIVFDIGSTTNSYFDFMGGLGYVLKFGIWVPFAEAKGGFTFGDESGSVSWNGMGPCLCYDVGFNLDLNSSLMIGLKYQNTNVWISTQNVPGTTVNMSSFSLSAGLRF